MFVLINEVSSPATYELYTIQLFEDGVAVVDNATLNLIFDVLVLQAEIIETITPLVAVLGTV